MPGINPVAARSKTLREYLCPVLVRRILNHKQESLRVAYAGQTFALGLKIGAIARVNCATTVRFRTGFSPLAGREDSMTS
jgi:hypothetical protein